MGVFAAATALAGRLTPIALAADQIAIHLAALSFMVPLGVSSAGAVRVGHALGRRDLPAAERAGWTAIFLGTGSGWYGCGIVLTQGDSMGAFTSNEGVVQQGVSLLAVAAGLSDLRWDSGRCHGMYCGASGDTRTPMPCNLVAHWFIGLPGGYLLCSVLGAA